MTGLELRFLGGVEVIRDGRQMALPPSKKTRALLAYLALNERSFRREHLCELLWEIPDDPRGSLRWSLSKLRRLVDEPGAPRILADRTSVSLDAAGIDIDVVALKRLAGESLADVPTAELEDAVTSLAGNFLEGLELSNFHTFQAWCVSEREAVTRAQAGILRTLIGRLSAAPERAIPYARRLVGLCPYDEADRARLIKLLVKEGNLEEAEQQYRFGTRMLKEIGKDTSRLLFEAWRGAPGGSQQTLADAGLEKTRPRREIPAVPSILVGRDAEAGRLRALFEEAARTRSPRMLLIQGPPGIGKSRLLDLAATMAETEGASVLRANSFESEAIRPFAVWMDAVRRLDPESTTHIFEGDELDNRDRLFDRLSGFVRSASEKMPVVVIFDDLQWCDESSAAALHFVARMNRDRPLIGVLAARIEELRDNTAIEKALRGLRHDGTLSEIKLAPLSNEAVKALIEVQAPEADSQALCNRCAGNPLLAIELARAESSENTASSLDELIRERLAGFDLNSAEIIRWAAVLSPRIDIDLLARMTELESWRVSETLESVERQAMLVKEDEGYRFTHDLVAQSIYADISPSRRQVMHRRIAEWLEKDAELDIDRAADLSRHASQSGDAGLASRAMISAGKLCLRFFANDDALALAQKGLLWARELTGAEQIRVTLDLHDIILSAAPLDDWESAANQYVSLAERALDYGARAHARLGYHMASYVRWMHGHWSGAREETLQAERVARGGSEEEHIIGMAETAKCLAMIERDLSQADAMLMEARALARRSRVNHHALPTAHGILRYHENELDEAEELFKEARTLCRLAGDRVNEFEAIGYRVMIELERGRFDRAAAHCKELLELGENIREGSERPFAKALSALCEYALSGDPAGLGPALDELRIADAKHRMAYTLIRAALLDLERGESDSAIARATEALEYARLLERASEVLMAHVVLASACQASGNAGEQEMHVAAMRELSSMPVAVWARNRADRLLKAISHD